MPGYISGSETIRRTFPSHAAESPGNPSDPLYRVGKSQNKTPPDPVDGGFTGALNERSLTLAVEDALRQSDLDALRRLLQNGADPHTAGLAALKLATALGDKSAVVELLGLLEPAGVNLQARDLQGDTAMTVAAREGHTEVLVQLVEASLRTGANLNATNQAGFTALSEAAYKGHVGAVSVLTEALLTSGGELNPVNEYGYTPLTRAAYMGHWDAVAVIAQALQQSGGNVDVVTPQCGSALSLAADEGHLKAMNMLLLAGAKASDDERQTMVALLGFAEGEADSALAIEAATAKGLKGVTAALSQPRD